MPINSRRKGAKGELELSKYLMKLFPTTEARRGQQFSGGTDSPDVVTSIPNIHIECKRVESLNLGKSYEQAVRDAGDKIPTVIHRKNRQPWMITLKLDDLEKLSKIISNLE